MKESNRSETVMAELYDRLSSEFYDYHAKRGDVEFYVGSALESGGPVLELGCGTGRVLIQTARAGVEITGLDLSAEMLMWCKKKLDAEPEEVRARTELVHSDMRSFELGRKSNLVTITFGPFNSLLTVEDQLNCLSCVHRHLNDGGRLVFDVFLAQPMVLFIQEETPIVANQPPFMMPDGRSVTWGLRFRDTDYQNQIIHENLTYDIRYPDGHEEHLVYPSDVRFYFGYEVEHLLARAGFAVEAVYGDFDKTPFGTTLPSEMILVARRK